MNACIRNVLVKIYQNTLYKFTKKHNYELLIRNKKFFNLHEGKRCFILGNGPSLAKQDLFGLRNEFVFTVNQAARNKQFYDICSNYHICIDQTFFRDDPDDPGVQELVATLKKVNDNSKGEKPECFFPVNQSDFVKKYGLDDVLNVNYLSMQYIVTDDKFPVDLSKPIPRFQTVVQTCIIAAIYMGFKEIYLLGCDNTGIVVSINSFLQKNNSGDYAYEVTENEQKRMSNLFEQQKLEDYVYAFYKSLVNYRNVSNYCKRRGIKLLNCTPETTIEAIKRCSLDEVLKC